jgi:signal transduction histidine kinase
VRIAVKGRLPNIHADPGRLEQVLNNLLSSAAKYSERDAEILVEIESCGDELCVAVVNRGEGIPPDVLPAFRFRLPIDGGVRCLPAGAAR